MSDLGTKMAQMNGTRIPGPRTDCSIWQGAHQPDARYFTPHYPHPCQVTQTTSATCRVIYKSSVHHCYRRLYNVFVLLTSPFISTMENYSIWKKKRKQLLNSSMVCCIHEAWMNSFNITLWFAAFCNIAQNSLLRKSHTGTRWPIWIMQK